MRSNPMTVDEGWLLDGFDAFVNRVSDYRGDAIDAGDLSDDGGAVADYLALPRSVDDVLAEVAMFGPGPHAVTLLESLTGRVLAPDHAAEVAHAWERQARWLSVRCAQANVAFVGVAKERKRDAARAQTSRVLELGLLLDVGDAWLTQVLLPQQRLLATTLSATQAEVEAGRLSAYRARMIADKLRGLDADVAREIEARVLPTAGQIKTGSLADKLRRAVIASKDPQQAAQEFRDGAQDRRVETDREPSQPGLLGLHAYLPADTAVALQEALRAKAAQLLTADEKAFAGTGQADRVRTHDQRMADALAWFVLGPDPDDASRPARPKFLVQLTMSLPALLALRDGCAELPGYGAVPADLAREWASDAAFQRFIHDPITGHLLDDGTRRYRPSARIRRFIRHRDRHDRFPGSNRRAEGCDADHLQPFTGDDSGGATSAANIASTGRPGHQAKTHSGWTVTGDANGVLTYRSPTGREYASPPHDHRDPEDLPPPTACPF